MATPLTPAELLTDCTTIAVKSSFYSDEVGSCLTVLLNTGAREGEVLDRARWHNTAPGVWILKPQKGNADRTVLESQLPDRFLRWLNASGFPYRLSSLMNLRRVVDQFSAYPMAYCGGKEISTHRFRHSYIKQLAIAGASIADIKAIMGLSSAGVITGYITSEIYPG